MATRLSIEDYDIDEMAAENPQMAELYSRYISAMMSTSTIYLFMINTPESLQKNDKLWNYMKTKNPGLYKRVARSLAGLANRKHAPIRKGVIGAYWLAKKIFKFA